MNVRPSVGTKKYYSRWISVTECARAQWLLCWNCLTTVSRCSYLRRMSENRGTEKELLRKNVSVWFVAQLSFFGLLGCRKTMQQLVGSWLCRCGRCWKSYWKELNFTISCDHWRDLEVLLRALTTLHLGMYHRKWSSSCETTVLTFRRRRGPLHTWSHAIKGLHSVASIGMCQISTSLVEHQCFQGTLHYVMGNRSGSGWK